LQLSEDGGKTRPGGYFINAKTVLFSKTLDFYLTFSNGKKNSIFD
jgi:hypothetical protein